MNTFTPGQRVTWLYKPIARKAWRQWATVVEQVGSHVYIRVMGVDGSYVRKVAVEAVDAEMRMVA